jgi:hypothetical protein
LGKNIIVHPAIHYIFSEIAMGGQWVFFVKGDIKIVFVSVKESLFSEIQIFGPSSENFYNFTYCLAIRTTFGDIHQLP